MVNDDLWIVNSASPLTTFWTNVSTFGQVERALLDDARLAARVLRQIGF